MAIPYGGIGPTRADDFELFLLDGGFLVGIVGSPGDLFSEVSKPQSFATKRFRINNENARLIIQLCEHVKIFLIDGFEQPIILMDTRQLILTDTAQLDLLSTDT